MTRTDHFGADTQKVEQTAMSIVFHIGDTLVPDGVYGVKLRQSTNDELIDFTMREIRALCVDIMPKLPLTVPVERIGKKYYVPLDWVRSLYVDTSQGGHPQ